MGRPRNISTTPYWSAADACWHAWPTIDGKRYHRRVKDPGRTRNGRRAVEQKVRELEDELATKRREAAIEAALPPKPAARYTVHEWLRYWLAEIVEPHKSYNTCKDYRLTIETLIIPYIVDVPLPDLDPEHIEAMLKRLRKLGSHDKPHRAYNRLRIALNAAVRRPKVTGMHYNPIKAVAEPELVEHEVEPLSLDEVQRVLTGAQQLERNGARWTIAMSLGLRQGEALALEWSDVDLDRSLLWVREATYRRKWLHGCADPHACGARFHRYPCPQTGPTHARYHRNGCPRHKTWCEPGCTRHAAQCPQGHGGIGADGTRYPGGKVRKAPKSKAGRRVIRLPAPLVAELRAHKAAQDRERLAAGDRWHDGNIVFATKWGHEINERDDYGQFIGLLEAAGVRRTRLHDSRHFAATMMLLFKVQPEMVMDVMGWSSPTMLRRYQHVLDAMRAEVADVVTGALWGDSAADSATGTATANITDLDTERRKRR